MIEHPLIQNSQMNLISDKPSHIFRKFPWRFIIFGFALLCGSVSAYIFLRPAIQQEKLVLQAPDNGSISRTDIESAYVPDGLPLDLPYGDVGTVLYNYAADAPSGRHQAVRSWEVPVDVETIITTYKQYLKEGGWEVLVFSQENQQTIFGATKNTQSLSMTVSSGRVTPSGVGSVITITVGKVPKPVVSSIKK